MSMASALTNHWSVAGLAHHGLRNNGPDGFFKVPAWNPSVIKGKHLFLRDKIASTGGQIPKAVPENSSDDIHHGMTKKWWRNMNANANMSNVESQEDFDEQLQKAGDKLTLVHFYSPGCAACKALHYKLCQLAGMHPELQFLMVNCDEQKDICNRLNVCVLPLFRFYRGAEGHLSSFSCTLLTIHKLKRAFNRHGIQLEDLGSETGLENSEVQSLAPPTNIPNATADASHNMDGDVDTAAPNDV